MARKELLSESEIRQFMKLANIKPLQEMGMGGELPVPRQRDEEEDEPGARDYMMEEEGDEEEPAPEMPAPEGGEEEMEMDMDLGAEEPVPDMDMGGDDMDMGGDDMDMGADGGKEEQFADIVDRLADLLGLDADVEIGGDEEMGGEVMDDEGGDLEGAMDAPAGDDEDFGVEMDDEGEGEEEIIAEVARRVAARLIREKKQDAVATKLAERIFRRLASK
jgi:hypothetical protein